MVVLLSILENMTLGHVTEELPLVGIHRKIDDIKMKPGSPLQVVQVDLDMTWSSGHYGQRSASALSEFDFKQKQISYHSVWRILLNALRDNNII